MNKHAKHAELIRAVLDGKNIERFNRGHGVWCSLAEVGMRGQVAELAAEYDNHEYRLHVPPPADVVRYRSIPHKDGGDNMPVYEAALLCPSPYEKITYDGATGLVKRLELVL